MTTCPCVSVYSFCCARRAQLCAHVLLVGGLGDPKQPWGPHARVCARCDWPNCHRDRAARKTKTSTRTHKSRAAPGHGRRGGARLATTRQLLDVSRAPEDAKPPPMEVPLRGALSQPKKLRHGVASPPPMGQPKPRARHIWANTEDYAHADMGDDDDDDDAGNAQNTEPATHHHCQVHHRASTSSKTVRLVYGRCIIATYALRILAQ